MAYIRDYAFRDSGDPFRFRLPKKLRKLKVGRALGRAARAGLGFVPGVGPIASQIVGMSAPVHEAAPAPVPEAYQVPEDETQPMHPLMAFARAYGWDVGDPGRKLSKRKVAASGPKAKATQKAEKRAARASGKTPKAKGTSARGSKHAGFGKVAGSIGNIALGALKDTPFLGGAIGAGEEEIGFTGFGKGKGRGFGFGGHRRSMNPANVRALRRSIRRLDGFEKLVKRIEKAYPRLKRAVGHSAPAARTKRGCR